jgi:hypothetical protein
VFAQGSSTNTFSYIHTIFSVHVLFFYIEGGGIMFPEIIITCLPNYMVLHYRRQECS